MFAVEHYVTVQGEELSRRWWTAVDDGCIWVEYPIRRTAIPLFEVEALTQKPSKTHPLIWSRRLSPEFFEWVPEQ